MLTKLQIAGRLRDVLNSKLDGAEGDIAALFRHILLELDSIKQELRDKSDMSCVGPGR